MVFGAAVDMVSFSLWPLIHPIRAVMPRILCTRDRVIAQGTNLAGDVPCTQGEACVWPESPTLWSPSDDGVQECGCPGDIGRVIHVDCTLHRIKNTIERLALARDTRGAPPGAIATADLPLLG